MTKDSLHEYSQPYGVTQAVTRRLKYTNNYPLFVINRLSQTKLSAQIIKYNNFIVILATYTPVYRNCLYTVPTNGYKM